MRDLPRGTQVVDYGDHVAFAYGAITLYGLPFLTGSTSEWLCNSAKTLQDLDIDSFNPRSETAATYRAEWVWALPVSLATTQGIVSFPPATEMFQFAGLPPTGLCIQPEVTGHTPAGFPHSEISGSTSARDSPKLNAACRVLHRLLTPRHPPRALCSLTTTATHQAVICRVARDAPCTYSAKLKIFNLPKHYPVVKVRPFGPDGILVDPVCPAIRWSVGGCPRIRGAMSTRTKTTTQPWSALIGARARARPGASRPLFTCCRCIGGGRPASGSVPGGGDEETRTPDPLLAKEMLCQLSYVPRRQPEWWATLDSNQ
jgi:hypothetical protein